MKNSPESAGAKPRSKSKKASKTSIQFEELAARIQTLQETLQKNKKDILALQVMLFTGIFLLMAGFFYYNNAVQEIRLEALDANSYLRQNQGDLNTMIVQKGVFQEIYILKAAVDRLAQKYAVGTGNHVEQSVVEMNNTLALLRNESSKVRGLSKQVQQASEEFLEAYTTRNTPPSRR